MRIAIFTDVHYAAGLTTCRTRTCFQSLGKLARIATELPANAYINLGDLVNDTGDDYANELNLAAALDALTAFPAHCFSLVGNHDVEVAPRARFTGHDCDWFSFELGGIEFLALDCNYTHAGVRVSGRGFDWTDAAIPDAEISWLRECLSHDGPPVILLSHHPLFGDPADPHIIRNQDAVGGLLRAAHRPVRAIIAGHYHPGAIRNAWGVPEFILSAVCERGGIPYAILDIHGDSLKLSIGDLGCNRAEENIWSFR